MTDVSELLKRMRSPMRSYAGTADLFNEAADSLETLAGEADLLRKEKAAAEDDAIALDKQWGGALDLLGPFAPEHGDDLPKVARAVICRMTAAESRLAKLAPVVEAARGIKRAEAEKDQKEWIACHDAMYSALAALEAAHD